MTRVDVVTEWPECEGYCEYVYPEIWGYSELTGGLGALSCWLGRLCMTCTAERQVVSISGYAPHQSWAKRDELQVPSIVPPSSFVISEMFDMQSRVSIADIEPTIECYPRQKAIRISLLQKCDVNVYVRPHMGLILGATKVDGYLKLAEFLVTDLRIGRPPAAEIGRPW